MGTYGKDSHSKVDTYRLQYYKNSVYTYMNVYQRKKFIICQFHIGTSANSIILNIFHNAQN